MLRTLLTTQSQPGDSKAEVGTGGSSMQPIKGGPRYAPLLKMGGRPVQSTPVATFPAELLRAILKETLAAVKEMGPQDVAKANLFSGERTTEDEVARELQRCQATRKAFRTVCAAWRNGGADVEENRTLVVVGEKGALLARYHAHKNHLRHCVRSVVIDLDRLDFETPTRGLRRGELPEHTAALIEELGDVEDLHLVVGGAGIGLGECTPTILTLVALAAFKKPSELPLHTLTSRQTNIRHLVLRGQWRIMGPYPVVPSRPRPLRLEVIDASPVTGALIKEVNRLGAPDLTELSLRRYTEGNTDRRDLVALLTQTAPRLKKLVLVDDSENSTYYLDRHIQSLAVLESLEVGSRGYSADILRHLAHLPSLASFTFALCEPRSRRGFIKVLTESSGNSVKEGGFPSLKHLRLIWWGERDEALVETFMRGTERDGLLVEVVYS